MQVSSSSWAPQERPKGNRSENRGGRGSHQGIVRKVESKGEDMVWINTHPEVGHDPVPKGSERYGPAGSGGPPRTLAGSPLASLLLPTAAVWPASLSAWQGVEIDPAPGVIGNLSGSGPALLHRAAPLPPT
jgi:hypothetical protein